MVHAQTANHCNDARLDAVDLVPSRCIVVLFFDIAIGFHT